jgi:hypothetical protein
MWVRQFLVEREDVTDNKTTSGTYPYVENVTELVRSYHWLEGSRRTDYE